MIQHNNNKNNNILTTIFKKRRKKLIKTKKLYKQKPSKQSKANKNSVPNIYSKIKNTHTPFLTYILLLSYKLTLKTENARCVSFCCWKKTTSKPNQYHQQPTKHHHHLLILTCLTSINESECDSNSVSHNINTNKVKWKCG